MVSRYGVSKEGAVGVAVGALGPMHCLLPHCGGPQHHHHLTASHPQNPQPGHNHHVHHGHQPPPPPSPSPHLNQLTHPQLTVNISHLGHHHHQHHQQQPQQQQQQPPQQQQQTQIPPQYRVTANRSEFHGNYSAQPGGQVGGSAASNVGVPTGRGPPPLGGIQTIGQSAAGIPPGGPAGGQAPSQAPTPGVQSQPPQGPAPTTTPPVHTPSPQEMGKQAHLQTQPPSLPQVYVPTQNRPPSQGYYQTGPRPQQPRGISHRGGQGASGTPLVGITGVGGGGGQPPTLYSHHSLPVQSAMYIGQGQGIHGIPTGPHQQSAVYPINNQMPIHQFSGPPPSRHQHQNQSFYQTFQPPPLLAPSNMFGYTHAPAPQPGYYYTASNTMSLTRASTSAVSGGAQHVTGPLAGTQGAPIVPQGPLQQPAQQAQPLPSMGIPLSQADIFSGHNGGAMNANNTTKSRKPRRENAIYDIVNPDTGKNISNEIYNDNETTQSGEFSNRKTPQPQNNSAEMIADFAARVAKAATEGSDTVSTSASETASNTIQTTTQTSLSNIQSNSSNDTNSQCSSSPPMTKNIAGAGASKTVPTINSQSLGTCSNATQIDSSAAKTESKTLQLPVKEFQPRSEMKNVTIEESSSVVTSMVTVANRDNVSVQLTTSTASTETTAVTATVTVETKPEVSGVTGAIAATGVVAGSGAGTETGPGSVSVSVSVPGPGSEAKHLNVSSNVVQTPVTPYWSNVTQEIPKPSVTASSANPVPTREPFPNLSKTTSNSPPRRKPNATELPSNTKEQKERKTREKSLGSRNATPTPVHNQATDHHHQKTNGDAVIDKTEAEVVHPRNEIQQKPSDGKAMQKQKNKNKLKPRDLNRKGAEKEGTDMDAFVNTVSSVTKPAEIKQDNKEQHVPVSKDSNKEFNKEMSKDIKDQKDNYELKKEKEKEKEILPVHGQKTEKPASTEVSKDSVPAQQTSHVVDKPPTNKESSIKSEDSTFNALPVASPNDVVDHAAVIEEMHLEALVAQKNEENFKVSALHASSNDEKASTVTSVITEKKQEDEVSSGTGNALAENAAPSANKTPSLKYDYKEGQWSPLNVTGRKSYDRDFLLRLQYDPNSKLKPANLPNLQAVLKDSLQNTHNTMDLRVFKDANITRHDSLLPGFAKTNMGTRLPTTSRKSDSRGKPKPSKPNVIHVSLSLREDVKLRETENAWKPARLKHVGLTEEETKTEALYKRVRSVLNKLTPQKFNTLVEQVRRLPIDTQERLQGVINLVFEKAVDEPSFSVEYALLCKELAMMEVAGGADTQESSSVSFKKLIITRCQKEFEKNPIDDIARNRRIKEIDECTDLEKKKELQLALEEAERRIRVKSVGNIRFIGELYKQQMLTTKIMHRCIRHLLEQNDEDNLECLCKLLTTIGKDLESKNSNEEMHEYFARMQEIVARKGHSKISSRIRFMLQDVIDLRANKWIPRRNENNPKTIDQIQKEAESERLDMQVNSASLNTARKDDRNNDRKRSRGLGGPTDDGWSQPVGRVRPATYSVETAKLKNKPPPMDDMQLGNRASYLWRTNPSSNSKTISSNKFACLENMSNLDQDKRMPPLPLSGSRSTGPRECSRDYKSYDGRSSRNGTHQSSASSRESHPLLDNSQNRNISMLQPVMMKSASQSGAISHKAPMTEQEFTKVYNSILKHYLEEPIVENTGLEIQQKFDNTTFAKLARECINHVLEKSPVERELVSKLLSHLLRQSILPMEHFKNGLGEILDMVDDLVIDIPKIWTYLAEILSHPIEDCAFPLSELKGICLNLSGQGFVGKFLGELLTKVSRDKGPKWLADKWDQSGLQLKNLIDPVQENADEIIQEYNLEFFSGDYNSAKDSAINEPFSFEKVQQNLTRLMKENTSFDGICNWITANVGSNYEKDPQFIRHLMTAILETTVEKHHDTWKLNLETFGTLENLIQRYVDANDLLELQCLYAIQRYIKKIEFPPGTLVSIMNRLWLDNVISSDAFLTWQKKAPEGPDLEGHSVSIVALTSFFTDLQEPDDNSSVEEMCTNVNQDC